MTMLHGRLELHGVDVELLARRATNAWLSSHRAHLQEADREDLVCYVVAEIWRASVGFDRERAGVSFASYGYQRASVRTVDWYRQRFGRTRWVFGDGRVHERERPVPLSLDAPGRNDPDAGPLGASLAGGGGDPAGSCDPALARLLDVGDRERARDREIVRGLAAPAARRRAAAAAAAA